uniref:Tail fiber n=1 Tax=Erwinia phage Fifi051 TaxID=3238787 RepID=A0AB39ACK6_9CAUD
MKQIIDGLTLDFAGTVLQGKPGKDGDKGNDGKSSYQSYVETTSDNPVKSEADWIKSLRGEPGEKGDSAYMSYVKTTTDNPVKTEVQWLASLNGKPGESIKGDTGKSSYQSYLDTTSDNPKKSEAEWVQSLHGKDGTGLTNRQAWVLGSTYVPGDYVFSNNADGNNSMWILSGDTAYVSLFPPKEDLDHWIEFQAPAGADGNGIKSVAIGYQAGTNATTVPTGTWVDAPPTVNPGQYLWTRMQFTMTNGDILPSYTVAYQGKNGTNGSNGVGVSSTAVAYQAGTSGTVTPTGVWTTAIPAVTKGQYLWTRTTITYSDASTSVGYSVSYIPLDGSNGVGITDVTTTYQSGTSGSTPPTGTWSATIPNVAKGSYLWTRTVITLSDASAKTLYSSAYQGQDGTGGSGGGTSVLLLTAVPTSSDGADGSVAMVHSANGYISAWQRTGTTWAKIWEMPLAQTADAKAATSSLIPTTPAGVREFMEQYGITATFTDAATNLNSIVRGQIFTWNDATTNTPVAGSYGRGFCMPSGAGYVTQLGIINDTGKTYVRFQSGTSTWSAWILIGPSSSGGGGGASIPGGVVPANVTLGATAKALGITNSGSSVAVTGKMYAFKAILLTQGSVGATFTVTLSRMGAQIFRIDCRSPNASGVIASSVSIEPSKAVTGCTGAAQEGVTVIEGVMEFNYVDPSPVELNMALASGDWCNILKGSSYTLTPIADLAMS